MDPDVALTTALDDNAYKSDRCQAATNLLTWLYAGGFMPADWNPPTDQHATARELLIATLRLVRESCRPTLAELPIRYPLDPPT